MGVANAMQRRWADIPAAHRRWLLVNTILITAVINFVLNAGIAWFSVRGTNSVRLWGLPLVDKPSTVLDTVGTFFFLPLFTCLMVTTGVWAELRAGRMRPLARDGVLARLPSGRLRRGFVLGAVCAAALSPIAVLVLVAVDLEPLTTSEFVLYKALLTVVLGAVVTPVIALCAMGDRVEVRAPVS